MCLTLRARCAARPSWLSCHFLGRQERTVNSFTDKFYVCRQISTHVDQSRKCAMNHKKVHHRCVFIATIRMIPPYFGLPVNSIHRYHADMMFSYSSSHPISKLLYASLCLLMLTMPQLVQAENKEPDGTQYVSREEIVTLLAAETGLSVKKLTAIMKDATFRPDIIKRMNTQWEAQPYAKYRPLFIKASMLDKGKAFVAEHRTIFDAVEQKYQVDSAIIAGILGIETRFGETHGARPILDSLYTLSTGFPRRANFFRQQLGAIIQISRQDKLNLKELKGSYAGAFGSIQFIPTSFRDFAVDEDGDGIRDVFNSKQDIIGSVANYFHKHGWQHGRPVAHWLPPHTRLNKAWRKRDKSKLKHWVTLAELRKDMPKIFNKIPLPWLENDKVGIIEMETSKGKQLALVHFNFRVIMRYNPSFNYAMAVTEIAAMWESEKFAVD